MRVRNQAAGDKRRRGRRFALLLTITIPLAIIAGFVLPHSSPIVEAEAIRKSAILLANQREQPKNITLNDLQAAAQRAADAGMTLAEMGTAQMADPNADPVPHYFSVPNYANSPLRLPDAIVRLVGGGGSGAEAKATVDPQTGAITAIDVTSPGSGYTSAPSVEIASAIITTSSGASATATVDYSGVVSAVKVTYGGDFNYSAPTVSIEGGGGSGATAKITGKVAAIRLDNPGSGYIEPVVAIAGGQGQGATGKVITDTVTGAITAIQVTWAGEGYTSAPTVEISDLQGSGSGATATAFLEIDTISVDSFGSGYTSAPSVIISDPTGTNATAEASITTSGGAVTGVTVTSGGTGYVTPGIRKFVDTLPGLGPSGANNLGNYIPVGVPDTTTYPGADYYEIAVVEYEQKMHSDLPPTKLRGYVQLATGVVPGKQVPLVNVDGSPILLPGGAQAYGVDGPHYLGPVISATKDRAVRILFRNLLPTGRGGDLFLPVDTTVMGAGMGPAMDMAEPDPRNPMCGAEAKDPTCYSENRATLHLHGGITPWISDGTPHQWITPAGEQTAYPKGVSVTNVPDMPDPGPGAMTFFYTNQQSARLMFYHDHAWGITRLNVYAGEAAGYLISDPAEQKLVADGVIPAEQLPLIIQDKTFVPDDWQLAAQDPLWNKNRWGGLGDLWAPHVYVPAQNPGDPSGVNQFGRWAYGPWFWPPTSNIDYPPIANPYYDPTCDPDQGWCEPQLMPGVPYVSMGMEAFNDTPLVNGVAYPTITVNPKSYRLRILNAANDRFFNLSLYQADGTGTEVALNAAEVAAALTDPAGVFPTPDESLSPRGPDWIQIGTEGGFLPSPTVIPAHPITWVTDPTVFNAGNVDQHSLLIAPAERADVIVDFSQYAGKTIILYNDSPAAFPARDPRYDYYTGNPDLTETGGAPSTPAGFGPNTRTVMQIKVAPAAPAPAFNLGKLNAAFAHKADGSGVFESSQPPIIVGQGAYNQAYGTTFSGSTGLVQIYDERLAFQTLGGQTLTMPMERKAIQDEMGEAFEKEYGRMSGNLGLETPNAQAGQAQNLILYPYVNPASEVLKGLEPGGLNITPIATTDDGTQIWKITHNGVDTHPIHFHLFDVQVINRVGWDGIIRKPDPNELGWKDTVRISPLEDTIVAMRPIIPRVPFGVPDSIRPLNPMMPIGSTAMFNSTDANGNPMPAITNQVVNFGWEYVWHCHILSHEEMDMMRPIAVSVSRGLPLPPAPKSATANLTTGAVTLVWTDGTPVDYKSLGTWGAPSNEIGFRVERATINRNGRVGTYGTVATLLANVTSYTDASAVKGTNYSYRVVAFNAAGATTSAPIGGAAPTLAAAPGNVAATLQNGPQIRVTWRDNASNEAYFLLERSTNGGAFTLLATPAANATSFVDTAVAAGKSYQYRVAATNGAGASAYGTSGVVTLGSPPVAPSALTGSVVRAGRTNTIVLNWKDNSGDETSFEIQRATNTTFTVGLTSTTVAANAITNSQTNLYRGVTYSFRIRAVNANGVSAWSNVFNIVAP